MLIQVKLLMEIHNLEDKQKKIKRNRLKREILFHSLSDDF